MAMNYNQTLSNLRDCIADIQNAINGLGLDGSQSMATWGSQLGTIEATLNELRNKIISDDTDFNDIYDAIVIKGQSPDRDDRDTYAPAILAITTGDTPNLQNKTVRATQSAQYVTADAGYDGLGIVNIEGVDRTIDSDIRAENIKKGVDILGVVGSYEGSGGGGIQINAHPTSLQYAGQQGNTSHSDVLPADGSWTTLVDLQNIDLANGLRYVFTGNTVITDIDLTGWDFTAKEVTNVTNMFNGCSNLEYIRGTLRLNKSTTFTNMFNGCAKLRQCPVTNFAYDTTTSTVTLDLSACALLDAESFINNLEAYTGTRTRIVKLHADVLAGLSDEMKALATTKKITLQ